MEALIVALFALLAMVLLEAGYWIALSLMRWAPVIAAGAIAGWHVGRYGAEPLEALGLGLIVCVVARRLLKPRWRSEYYDDNC